MEKPFYSSDYKRKANIQSRSKREEYSMNALSRGKITDLSVGCREWMEDWALVKH